MASARSASPRTGGPPSGPCYVRAAVPGSRPILRGATAAAAAVALALAGCGGSDEPQAEQSITYSVAIPVRSFPARQLLAEHVQLRLDVRNEGTRAIPNVAATIATGGGRRRRRRRGVRLAARRAGPRLALAAGVDRRRRAGQRRHRLREHLGARRDRAATGRARSRGRVVPVRAGATRCATASPAAPPAAPRCGSRTAAPPAAPSTCDVSGKPRAGARHARRQNRLR